MATTDPLLAAILSSKVSIARVEGIIILDEGRSPNKIYTFRPGYRPLAQLGRATREYTKEEHIEPSMLRLPPDAYDEVLSELVSTGDSRLYYFLDGITPFPVDFHTGLQQQQVECVGSHRTAPRIPVVVEAEVES